MIKLEVSCQGVQDRQALSIRDAMYTLWFDMYYDKDNLFVYSRNKAFFLA